MKDRFELRDVRVLVVEDDPDCRTLMRRQLESAGAIVLGVDSVADALLEIDDFLPDVIVSDLMLPGESGFDLLCSLRSGGRQSGGYSVPAIAVTGLPLELYRVRSRSAGFDAFLQKPFETTHLVSAVAHAKGMASSLAAP